MAPGALARLAAAGERRLERWRVMEETLRLLSSPVNAERLRGAIAEIEAGGGEERGLGGVGGLGAPRRSDSAQRYGPQAPPLPQTPVPPRPPCAISSGHAVAISVSTRLVGSLTCGTAPSNAIARPDYWAAGLMRIVARRSAWSFEPGGPTASRAPTP